MSIENDDGHTQPSAGVPPGYSVDGSPVYGLGNMDNTPPMDQSNPLQDDPGAVAKAKADLEAAKERAVQAEPSTLGLTGSPSRKHGFRDSEEAAKAASQNKAAGGDSVAPGDDAIALGASTEKAAPLAKTRRVKAAKAKGSDTDHGVQHSEAVAKAPRRSRAATKSANVDALEQAPGNDQVKPARARRKAASKGTPQEQAQPEDTSMPVPGGSDIPSITEEAITFLSNPDATAIDLFKLQPESQTFVQYHITNMQRQEAQSALQYSYLMSTAQKYSPAFEKVADALVDKLTKMRPALASSSVLEPDTSASVRSIGVFYGPKQVQTSAHQTIGVRLGKMEIELGKVGMQDEVNTIERGVSPERENPLAKDPQKLAAPTEPLTSSVLGPPPGFGRRLLRSMGVWLQSRADFKAGPAGSARPALQDAQPVPGKDADDKTYLVPEVVARRFLKVERDYYFPDKTHAFADRGVKLATRSAHPEVVRSLIEIAKARGWDRITVKGTDEFRRSAWMEAAQAGLQVAGYKPTALDLAELTSKPANNWVKKGIAKVRDVAPALQWGPAQPPTTLRGEGEAQPTAVSKAANVATPSAVLAEKARAFEQGNPGFVVKAHPELAQAFGVVEAAKKFADANLPEAVRDEFVSLARRHVIQKILAGEQVKGPKVYMAPPKAKDSVDLTRQAPQRSRDIDKASRARE